MRESTITIKDFGALSQFAQEQKEGAEMWQEHGRWKAAKINGIDFLYVPKKRKVTFRGEARKRIP